MESLASLATIFATLAAAMALGFLTAAAGRRPR
jgi:hypothetical protein